jgi:hypothetical protein
MPERTVARGARTAAFPPTACPRARSEPAGVCGPPDRSSQWGSCSPGCRRASGPRPTDCYVSPATKRGSAPTRSRPRGRPHAVDHRPAGAGRRRPAPRPRQRLRSTAPCRAAGAGAWPRRALPRRESSVRSLRARQRHPARPEQVVRLLPLPRCPAMLRAASTPPPPCPVPRPEPRRETLPLPPAQQATPVPAHAPRTTAPDAEAVPPGASPRSRPDGSAWKPSR